MKERLKKANTFINLKEKLNIRFYNLGAIDANLDRSSNKYSYWEMDEFKHNTHGWYDKYTNLNAPRDKIYQEWANMEF